MIWSREPALIVGVVGAVLALAVGFGLPITPGQVGLITAALAAVLAVVTRSQVRPVKHSIPVAKAKPRVTTTK